MSQNIFPTLKRILNQYNLVGSLYIVVMLLLTGCLSNLDINKPIKKSVSTNGISVIIGQAVSETVGECSFTAPNNPTNSPNFSYKVTFSDSIDPATFKKSDIVNTGSGGAADLQLELKNCGDNKNFKVTATQVVGDGPIVLELNGTKIQDSSGNTNPIHTDPAPNIIFDSVAPTVTINQAANESVESCSFSNTNDPTASAGFSYKVSFSEAIDTSTFTVADIANTGTGGATTLNWSLANCGDNTNFKLTASSIVGDGTIIPNLAANAVKDLAGNDNLVSTSTDNSVVYDTILLAVAINQSISETVGSCSFLATSDPANASGSAYKVSFSHPIDSSTFSVSDIVNAGTGGASTLTWSITDCGDDKNFKLTATTISGDGTIIPQLPANTVVALDGHNNLVSTATDNSITLDSSAPSVTINQATAQTVGTCSFTAANDPTNSTGFSYKVAFSEAINATTFTTADITNSGTGGGTLLTWTLANCGDNRNFKLTATAITGAGSIIPQLAAGSVQDAAGNNNTLSTSTDSSVTFDATAPTLTINQATTQTVGTCSFTAPADPTNVAGLEYKIVFSKAINTSTFSIADINNAGTGGATSLVWTLVNCGDDINFKLTATTIVGDGTIIPQILGSTIQDIFGNNNAASTSTDSSVTYSTAALNVTINQAIAETVGTCTFTATTDPRNTANFSYRATFSTAIQTATFTTADITNNGTGGGTLLTWTLANCGDDTNFKLTATAVTGNGTIIPQILSNTVLDLAGNNNSLYTATDNTVTYDTAAPTVTINQATTQTVGTCSFTAPNDPINAAGFSYKVVFSEAINTSTFTTADITNSGTGGGTTLTWTLDNCGDDINFKLTASAVTGNGTIVPQLTANKVQDPAGNNNTAATATDNSITFDATAPTLTINQATTQTVGTCSFTAPSDPSNVAGFEYKIVFSKAINTSTFTTADINNAGTGGATSILWTLVNCGDATNFKLTATTIVGDGTIVPQVLGSTVQDSAGNNNAASTATDNSVTYDTTAMSVTINQSVAETVGTCTFSATNDPTNAAGFAFKVTFGTTIQTATFTTADVTNNGTGGTTLTWTITNCGDNQNFKLTSATANGNGTIIPQILANKVLSTSGNNNALYTATDNTITLDKAKPSVAINQAIAETIGTCTFTLTKDPSTDPGFAYKILFNEVINSTTFDTTDITNSGTGGTTTLNWTIDNCGDDRTFKLTATAVTGFGTIIPGIAANKVTDAAGNNNNVSTATDNSVSFEIKGWIQEAYIKAINSGASDLFGTSVSISGDTLVVGAPGEESSQTSIINGTTASSDNSSTESGAVYVYKRAGYSWVQEAYIKAVNANSYYSFGVSTSISGDTLAVGSNYEASSQSTITNGATAGTHDYAWSGAVYIYVRSGATWSQQAYIKASNSGSSDNFGEQVFLNADTLVVGSTNEDSNRTTITNGTTASTNNSKTESGATYVYKRTGTAWAQEAYIKASNNDAGDLFGGSVSLNADTIAVGSFYEDSAQLTITNGAAASTDNTLTNSGAVYVYKRSGKIWSQEAYIKPVNAKEQDKFGSSVSVSGDTLAIGASLEESSSTTIINGATASADSSGVDNGAVYIYKRVGTNWSQEAYIKAVNSDYNHTFGDNVYLSGNTLIVGSKGETSTQKGITNGTGAGAAITYGTSIGAVYVYKRTGVNWSQEAYIKSINADYNDNFSSSIALDGDTLVVGAMNEDSNQTGITNGTTASSDNTNSNSGAVYVYRNENRVFDPGSLVATSATTSSIVLNWSAAGTLTTGYKIAYVLGTTAPVDCSSGTVIDVGNVLTYPITGLTMGKRYSFRICPYDASAVVSQGYTSNFQTLAAIPEVATFTWTATVSNQLTFNWTSGGGAVTGYKFAYATGQTAPADCASGTILDLGNVLTYNMTGVGTNAFVSARVCAYDASANLTFGQQVTAKSLPTPEPTNVYTTSTSTTAATIRWTSGGGVTQGFRVAWASGTTAPIDCSSGTNLDVGNVTSYVVSPLTESQIISARVCSYDVAGADISVGATVLGAVKTNGWTQEAYIKAVNNDSNDNFGTAVSISGDTLAVGAKYEASSQSTITNGTTASSDNSQSSSGAVYVYKRTGNDWVQEAYIKAANSSYGSYFGSTVSLDRDTLVVGSSGEENAETTITTGSTATNNHNAWGSGAVYVYNRSAGNWTQEAYIKSVNNAYGNNFGSAVSLSGLTIAVSATQEDSNLTTITNGATASSDTSHSDSGAVYVYKRTGNDWVQEAYIKAAYNTAEDYFGTSISLHGDTLAVGVRDALSNVTTVMVPAPSFNKMMIAKNTKSIYDLFDYDMFSLLIDSATASLPPASTRSGGVYVYKRSGVTWVQEAYIKAANKEVDDSFGDSVSLSGDTLAVGAPGEDSSQTTITTAASSDNSSYNNGAVYVYQRSGSTWAQQAYVKPNSSYGSYNAFGSAVSLNGNTLVARAVEGVGYVFKRTGVTWTKEISLAPINYDSNDYLATAISQSGDTIVMGAYGESSNQTSITNGTSASTNNSKSSSGAVYVYRNTTRLFEVTDAMAKATSETTVTIDWSKSGGTATGYMYAYAIGSTAPADCLSGVSVDAGDVSGAMLSGLTSGTTYSFRVCAYQNGTTRTEGRTVSVTTP